jgi:hypothetical protein
MNNPKSIELEKEEEAGEGS